MQKPYFSILVPVYNTADYLLDCVRSVLSQAEPDFELVLVDDGSTDESPALLDSLEKQDPRIRVYHKENAGLMHTRRFGIAHSSGSHIVFLDSDDCLADGALSVIRNAFETYGTDCVFYGVSRFNETGYLDEEKLCPSPCVINDKRELYRTCLLNDTYNSLCIKSVKRTVFDGRNYSPFLYIQSGEDLLQSLEILQNCSSAVLLPDILYRYRQVGSSVTHVRKLEPYSLDMVLPEKILEFLRSENVFTESDFNDFRSVYGKAVLDKVMTVCRSAADTQTRNRLLNRIHDSLFCRDYLFPEPVSLRKGKLLYDAFRTRRFGLTGVLVRLYDAFLIPLKKLLK